jgi:hypothetical protein
LGLAAHVGDALVGVPVLVLGERLVDAVVKVLVVREDDMATDVVELGVSARKRVNWRARVLTKPSGVTSVEARPPGVSFASTISHEGPS